jgi:sugar phosphate isomerase/epimerase
MELRELRKGRRKVKIGLRIPGTGSKMPFDKFCQWCKENGFEAIDVSRITKENAKTVADAALVVGSVDLAGVREILSSDAKKQKDGAEAAKSAIQAAADNGAKIMFCVLMPEDATKGRAANFEIWKQTFPPIVEFAASKGVSIAIEGWPGPGPYYPSLGCTPEMFRAIFEACPLPALGVNYDPSHLVRIGIDYDRFLYEFGSRLKHVHGKDTVFDQEALYLHGNLGPTFKRPGGFGEDWWRYCIPGEGLVDWGRVIKRLEDVGFDGIISVELEDSRYWRTWEAESEGLLRSKTHLKKFMR